MSKNQPPKRKTETANVGTGYRGTSIEIPLPPTWFEKTAKAWTDPALLAYTKRLFLVLFLPVAIFALLIFIGFYLFGWHSATARVTSIRWQYRVEVRTRTIAHSRDWQDEMQTHHYNEFCHEELRGHHDCNPHDCNEHSVAYQCNCTTVRNCSPNSTYCSSSESCSTCYRMEHDTCYDRCPDYDQMCEYDYPSWPVVQQLELSAHDHILIRPTVRELPACPQDPEILFVRNIHSGCTEDKIRYFVDFQVDDAHRYGINPSSQTEYDWYNPGQRWRVLYNRIGQFRVSRRER